MNIKTSRVIVLKDKFSSVEHQLKYTEHGNYQIMGSHDMLTLSGREMENIVEFYHKIQEMLQDE